MNAKNMPCKKTYFSDEKQAQIYIDKLCKTSKRKSVPVRSYLCSKCSCWHLTSKEDKNIIRNTFKKVEELEAEIRSRDEYILELKKNLTIKEEMINALNLDFELMRAAQDGNIIKDYDKYKNIVDNLERQNYNKKNTINNLEEKIKKLEITNENYLKRIMEQNVIIHRNK